MLSRLLALALTFCASVSLALPAQAADWVVEKMSGMVWVAGQGVQPAALGKDVIIAPGETIQTGPNGRVLLKRGEEAVLIAPNSVLTLPKEQRADGFTTFHQRAGTISVQAEKKDRQHFEVETPYLVAVVKGTQFTVSVGDGAAKVDVHSGQVEVGDHRSGQVAMVMPGQSASVSTAAPGLQLNGTGQLAPIQHGTPRASPVDTIRIPRGGFTSAPRGLGSVAQLGGPGQRANGLQAGAVRISQPIGAVHLNASAATGGFVRTHRAGHANNRTQGANGGQATIWGDAPSGTTGASTASATSFAAPGLAGGNGGSSSSASNGGGATAANIAAGGLGVVTGNAVVTGNSGGNGHAYGLNGGNGIGHAYGLHKFK